MDIEQATKNYPLEYETEDDNDDCYLTSESERSFHEVEGGHDLVGQQ